MLTPRGVVFAIFHAVLLAVGLLRDELGIVVWAGGLLLVVVVVGLLALIVRTRLFAERGAFAAELERSLVEAGEEIGVRASVPRVGMIPGFQLWHHLRLEGTGGRVVEASRPVAPGRPARWSITPTRRGAYHAPGSTLEATDLFGFTRSRIRDQSPVELQVLPPVVMERPPLPARRGGDRAAERSNVRVRSEELREVRPYVPGDDVRRLSWKHLAAHDELLIRIGEFVPPSRGEVRCRVDARVPTGASAVQTGDLLMEALRAVIHEAAARGVRVRCVVPGQSAPLSVETDPVLAPGDEASARAAGVLAGFLPRRDGDVPTTGGPGELLITALPAGAGSRGHVLSVAALMQPDQGSPSPWKRLVFREAS